MNYDEISNKLVDFAKVKERRGLPIREVTLDTAVSFAMDLAKNYSVVEQTSKTVITLEKMFAAFIGEDEDEIQKFKTIVELYVKQEKTVEGIKILHKVTTVSYYWYFYEQIDYVESKDLEECVKKHQRDAIYFAKHQKPETVLLRNLGFKFPDL